MAYISFQKLEYLQTLDFFYQYSLGMVPEFSDYNCLIVMDDDKGDDTRTVYAMSANPNIPTLMITTSNFSNEKRNYSVRYGEWTSDATLNFGMRNFSDDTRFSELLRHFQKKVEEYNENMRDSIPGYLIRAYYVFDNTSYNHSFQAIGIPECADEFRYDSLVHIEEELDRDNNYFWEMFGPLMRDKLIHPSECQEESES